MFGLSPASVSIMGGAIGAASARFAQNDPDGAADAWLTIPFGDGYRTVLERTLPGAVNDLARHAPTAFVEASSMQTWPVGPDEVKQIRQPVLSVFEVNTSFEGFQEVHDTLVKLLPQTEMMVVPNATHLLQIQNPSAVAQGLAQFCARHSSGAT
jgi:pimeloyl-ACP methyl ester carboxylesterase